MTHRLILVKQTDEFVEWECPACARHIRVELRGGGLTILKPGDRFAIHSATTVPGMDFDVSVETTDTTDSRLAPEPKETPVSVH